MLFSSCWNSKWLWAFIDLVLLILLSQNDLFYWSPRAKSNATSVGRSQQGLHLTFNVIIDWSAELFYALCDYLFNWFVLKMSENKWNVFPELKNNVFSLLSSQNEQPLKKDSEFKMALKQEKCKCLGLSFLMTMDGCGYSWFIYDLWYTLVITLSGLKWLLPPPEALNLWFWVQKFMFPCGLTKSEPSTHWHIFGAICSKHTCFWTERKTTQKLNIDIFLGESILNQECLKSVNLQVNLPTRS